MEDIQALMYRNWAQTYPFNVDFREFIIVYFTNNMQKGLRIYNMFSHILNGHKIHSIKHSNGI